MDEHFFITHDGYAPKRFLDQFNRLSRSMSENGLYKFYSMYSMFLGRIRSPTDIDVAEFQPLKLEQLYFFVTVFIIQLIIAIIVFITELIVHRIQRKLRAQRNHITVM